MDWIVEVAGGLLLLVLAGAFCWGSLLLKKDRREKDEEG